MKNIPHYLLAASFCGLALFIPFSIAGANAAIMIGFVAVLILALTDSEARGRYRLVKGDPMLFGALLLVLSALPAVLMSENLPRALRDWKSYWILLVYFLVAYNLTSDRLRRTVFWILLGSASASSLVALVQYLGGLEIGPIKIASQSYRPGGTLYNMTFAGILYQLITLNVTSAIQYKPRDRGLWAIALGVACQLAALLLTLTRGAWLALIAGFLAIPFTLRRKRLLFAVIGVFVITGFVAIQNDRIRDRAVTIVKSVRQPTDSNVSTRLVLWDISWEVFKEHPIFGVGMGDYSIEAKRHLANRDVRTTVDSHNIYLQMLATRGLFGFIPFVVFWILLFRGLRSSLRDTTANKDRFAQHFVAGTIAAAIAILVGALTENNIDDSEVFICFMFLVGVARSHSLTRQDG